MYARIPHLSKKIVHPSEEEMLSHDEYVKKSALKMKAAFEIVTSQMNKHLQYRGKLYQNNINYQVGDKVLVFLPTRRKGLTNKLIPGWTPPFTITKKISDVIFEMMVTDSWYKSLLCNVQFL